MSRQSGRGDSSSAGQEANSQSLYTWLRYRQCDRGDSAHRLIFGDRVLERWQFQPRCGMAAIGLQGMMELTRHPDAPKSPPALVWSYEILGRVVGDIDQLHPG